MGWNDAKHRAQIGMRLAVTNVAPQMRHGAGNSTDASASIAERRITRLKRILASAADTTRKNKNQIDRRNTDAALPGPCGHTPGFIEKREKKTSRT
jgi:hypothetical protein